MNPLASVLVGGALGLVVAAAAVGLAVLLDRAIVRDGERWLAALDRDQPR